MKKVDWENKIADLVDALDLDPLADFLAETISGSFKREKEFIVTGLRKGEDLKAIRTFIDNKKFELLIGVAGPALESFCLTITMRVLLRSSKSIGINPENYDEFFDKIQQTQSIIFSHCYHISMEKNYKETVKVKKSDLDKFLKSRPNPN